MVRGTRLPLQVCLSVAVAGLCGPLMAGSAGAALLGPRALPAGGGWPGSRFGNGRANHNSFIINSPSNSSDIQHIRNVNVGGTTVTPAAICKGRVRHCRIIQRLSVFDP
ncbi:hypothetical protein [Actinoallomurus acaciae]|uniref:Uncharacterized protein n=1 Tax=Actinoallomurus acaciae TaxID=502577 RepID=A0ABV5YXR5_9ACTN